MHVHFIQNYFFLFLNPTICVLLFSLGRVKLPGNKNSLGQKLSGLLSSDGDCRKVKELDNPHEILKLLIDLVRILLNYSSCVLWGGNIAVDLDRLPHS